MNDQWKFRETIARKFAWTIKQRSNRQYWVKQKWRKMSVWGGVFLEINLNKYYQKSNQGLVIIIICGRFRIITTCQIPHKHKVN